ncbi:MAG: bifunctional 3-(3-hydroxy-phenyl)propionate/3-hydroxycinnamic acid hydroxylase [Paracoccaceae bacterium]|nr:bifunctional 3-(3-hydroxy-phenyl)propionate/3-hydroxycinnamic acid hydroxylase [Paracoccaceae bacterium]
MKTDVAVIGAGPVGLLVANLLGRRRRSVTIVEKRSEPYSWPRAIHFDGEAMRCFQAAGLARSILHHTHVGKGMLFRDRDGTTLVDWSRDQTPGPMGWHESYRFYQPGLEQELRKGLGRHDCVALREGAAVVDLVNGDDVSLVLEDGSEVVARFVVAADGAQSFARQTLGIGFTDLGFCERWLVVDLVLRRRRDDLGDHSIQFCDPVSPATYVRGAGNRRRWEFRLCADSPDVLTEAEVWTRLSRWITPADAELERATVYTFRSGLADSWMDGNVFLAGDAAHQMPPFMGQGMCAGVRDAANLCWKLDAVLGGADEGMLGTYQSERESNVHAFINTSVSLGQLVNQTSADGVPRGRMFSIWPNLGPGLGPRDGVGGILVPQVQAEDGRLADSVADHGFYILAASPISAERLPVQAGASRWLQERSLEGVVVRPDGYALGGFRNRDELAVLEGLSRTLTPN